MTAANQAVISSLTFTSGPVAGKTMVVQSTNTGGDLGSNHFDLQIPGGGVGIFDGCTPQFGGLAGERYGGISDRSSCDSFPAALKPGCLWRFDWFKNADNPTFTFKQVQCPAELVARTGCKREDDGNFPVFTPPTGSNTGGSQSSSAVASSSTSKAQTSAASSTSKAVVTPVSSSTSKAAEVPKSSSTSKAAEVAKPSSTSISTSTSTSTKASCSATGGSCVAQKWAQCGGNGFTGCTSCVSGTTCQKQNDWYSQCL